MRAWGLCILILGLLFSYAHDRAVAAEAGCGPQTLRGTYAFSTRGWNKLDQRGYKPVAYIGMLSFDGKGNVWAKFRADTDKSTQVTKGSYTFGKTCEADVTLKNGRKATYFVSPSGNTYSFVVTSGVVASGDVQRIDTELLLKPAKSEGVTATKVKAKTAPQQKAQPKKG